MLAARSDLLPAIGAHVASSRYLTDGCSALPTVVLGDKAATRLGITEIRPGEPVPTVWLGERWFTVIGVLAPIPLAPDVERAAKRIAETTFSGLSLGWPGLRCWSAASAWPARW